MPRNKVEIEIVASDRASRTIGGVQRSLGGLGNVLGGVVGGFAALGGFLVGGVILRGLEGVARGLFNIAGEALNAAAEMQNFNVALETLAARELVMAGGAENIEEALDQVGPVVQGLQDDLRKLALISPFEFRQIADTFRAQMAFGATAETAMDLTKSVLDTGSALGLTGEQFGRLQYNLGQALVAGDLTAANLRQLKMVGLDLAGILEDELGMSIEDIRAQLKDGALDMEDVSGAFMKYTDENFGGAAERMSKTFSGLKSSIKDLFFFAGADLLTPALEVASEFLGELFDIARGLVESGKLAEIGEQLAGGLERVIDFAERLISGDIQLTDLIPPELVSLGESFMDFLDRMGAWWDEHGSAIKESAGDMFTRLQEVGEQLVEEIFPWLSEQFDVLATWFENNGPLIEDFVTVVSDGFAGAMEAIGALWAVAEPILSGLIQIILGVAEIIMRAMTGDWAGAWQAAIEVLAVAGQAIMSALNALFEWAANLVGTTMDDIRETWANNWNMAVIIVTAAWERIKGAVSSAIQAILGFLRTKISAFKQFGRDLIEGIKAGVVAAAHRLIAAVKAAVQGALQAARDAMGIHSPSAIFAGVGQDMMRGLALGIQGAAGIPAMATAQAAQSITYEFHQTVHTAATTHNVMADFETTRAIYGA